jgi:hypothetical protein
MTGLFLAMWFSWVGFTLYANRFDTDDIVFRIAKLAATGTIAGCAASASDAIGKLAVPFAACYLGNRLVLLASGLDSPAQVAGWLALREGIPTTDLWHRIGRGGPANVPPRPDVQGLGRVCA